jgi:phenylacetate-CoA ligase
MAQTLPEITVQVESMPDCADVSALCPKIEAALRAAFNLRVPVVLAESGALPRFELKAKRWIRREI